MPSLGLSGRYPHPPISRASKEPGSKRQNFVYLPLPDDPGPDPGPDSPTKVANSESPKPACKPEPQAVTSGPVPEPEYLELLPEDQWDPDDLSSAII